MPTETARIWGKRLTIVKELKDTLRILNYNGYPVQVRAATKDAQAVLDVLGGPPNQNTQDVLEAMGGDLGILRDVGNFITLEPFQEYNAPGTTFTSEQQLIFEVAMEDHASVEPNHLFVEATRELAR